jgi:tetrahydromethanopterin S-methyltransferase subunit G
MSVSVSLALSLLAIAAVFLFLNRKIARKASAEDVLARLRVEVNAMVIELNQTTERNIGLIEDRIRELKKILDAVDRRITVVQRESEKHDKTSQLYSNIMKKRIPEAPVVEPAEAQSLHERILDLHRRGFSAESIAGKVGSTVGEVDLVISLQDRKENR